MTRHFADRLLDAIENKGVAACVGLDPLPDRLPPEIARKHDLGPDAPPDAICRALEEYGTAVLETVAPLVPAVKINIAFFERYYDHGVRVYLRLTASARRLGLLVIGDVKRADIGHSTTQYARAQLADVTFPGMEDFAAPDAATVNPYFGIDGVRPFIEIAQQEGKGIFVLVQTSNESAIAVQGLDVGDGMTLCQKVAQLVESWSTGDDLIGERGYSLIGAVVSPRDISSTIRIRELMPRTIFLVPGFGAQGRTADEVKQCFHPDGTGALITSSRGVIYAYEQETHKKTHGDNWRACVEAGCKELVDAIRRVTTVRK